LNGEPGQILEKSSGVWGRSPGGKYFLKIQNVGSKTNDTTNKPLDMRSSQQYVTYRSKPVSRPIRLPLPRRICCILVEDFRAFQPQFLEEPMAWQRPDGRTPDQLRPVRFERHFTRFAAGSVLAHCGDTQVLCTVSVQPGAPKFLEGTGQGWLTAEYRMLPSATPQRHSRETLKLSGRTQEIQRLIGRSLRSVLDLKALGERTLVVDADVLQADAGTRTTSITGSYVALADAIQHLIAAGELERSPLQHQVAAVSVGLLEGEAFLDLSYPEDVAAAVDFNVVLNDQMQLIEVQGTAEEGSFSRIQMNQLLDLAEGGIQTLMQLQCQALAE
jgi:ribonuclease PH